MSPEKKVIILFLSLIVFIVACVYTHLPKIMKDTNKEPTIIETILEKEKDISKEENISEETSFESNESSQIGNKNEIVETVVVEENEEQVAQETQTANEEQIKEETLNEEFVEEVIEKPLITTDKRYIREDSEKNIENLSKQTQELQIKINKYVKNNPVTFKRVSAKLTKKSNKTIKKVVEYLKKFSNLKIEVAGHTDSAGAAKVNQAISLARAKSVESRLVKYGVKKERIIARGYGEDIPLVKNSSKGYSKINRRVEFNIVEE